MLSTSAILLAAALLATVHGQASESTSTTGAGAGVANYIEEVCMPFNASNFPDMAAPCNQVAAIEFECLFGPGPGLKFFYQTFSPAANSSSLEARQSEPGSYGTGEGDEPTEQSYTLQRDCLCSSQFFGALVGCADCEAAHGSTSEEARISKDKDWVTGLNSAYCATNSTPYEDLSTFLNNYYANHAVNSTSTIPTQTAISDPLHKSTAVDLYYTPSVTGPAAWVVAETSASAMASAGAMETGAVFAGLKTSNGLIVPTAVANAKVPSEAAPTPAMAAAGVLGLAAGVIAFL